MYRLGHVRPRACIHLCRAAQEVTVHTTNVIPTTHGVRKWLEETPHTTLENSGFLSQYSTSKPCALGNTVHTRNLGLP